MFEDRNNKFRVGDIVFRENSSFLETNSLNLITSEYIEPKQHLFLNNVQYTHELLNLKTGLYFQDHKNNFRRVNDKIVKNHLKEVKEQRDFCRITSYLREKSIITLKYDILISKSILGINYSVIIPKGTIGIIDNNSEINISEGIRGNPDPDNIELIKLSTEKICGNYKINELMFPCINIYFPSINEIHVVNPYKMELKIFDEFPEKNIQLPNNYLPKMVSLCNRVLNTNLHNEIYNKLGLSEICSKGRGAIFLLYGKPGTGKTMTAEIIAEKLQKILVRVNIPHIFHGGDLLSDLQFAFSKAKKYDAILLLDEIDVLIRRRGENPMFDENTSIFLKALEYYDGILFLTTNLVNLIDPAIFSRIHACFEYKLEDIQSRRSVWKKIINDSILKFIVGDNSQHEIMFNELSEIKINGREIKTAVQNAVTHAVTELKGTAVPDIKWIPKRYFIEEALEVEKQRDDLKGGV